MRRAVTAITALKTPVAVVVAMALGLGFALAGCGGESPPSPTPTATVTVTETATPTPTTIDTGEPSAITTVSLYFLRGETLGVSHRAVPATGAPATAAMDALLRGPDKRERAAGLSTTIPKSTTLNGVAIKDGTARVDLSEEFAAGGGSLSMQARVAQVVFTLTQFRTVKRVDFLIDGALVDTLGGEGLTLDAGQRRADWKTLLPAIFVERPAVGDVVDDLITLGGTAMVFEATFQAEILGPGDHVLASKTVTATRGAPGRGTFRVEIPFGTPSRRVSLRVYQVSMADGSRVNTVTIPLRHAASD